MPSLAQEKDMDFKQVLSWMNWLYSCLFGAICLGYGIAFAGHGLALWDLPHLSPFFSALSLASWGCANLSSSLQKLMPAREQAHDQISVASAEDPRADK
jgi:hypothetical protein